MNSSLSEPPVPLPVTLDRVTITQVHSAALALRTTTGQQRHYLIDLLNRQWAEILVNHPGNSWHLELKPSPYPGRYTLSTAVEE